MASLKDVLVERTHEAAPELVERIDEKRLRCYACGHECPIPEGALGVCKVRFVRDGTLYVPWGYVGGVQCDPIEKKPFFHARPGALAYSFGMLGCDLHCSYCQNWVTSQALRDPTAVSRPMRATPEEMVREAVELGARAVVSTYNEPLITAEWAVAVFKEAKKAGLATGFVSNGNGTPQVLEYLRPWVDLYKVDLKSFDDRHYRQLGGRLEPILRALAVPGEDVLSYDATRWQVDKEDGSLLLTNLAERLTPCDRFATGIRGTVAEPGKLLLS